MNIEKLLKQEASIRKATVSDVISDLLVITGTGGGKTTLAVRRIKHLIKNIKVKPRHILIITFSRDASANIAKKLSSEGL